ncbi:condensation domain-containing protein [Streptomyces sp. NPDC001985]|uniref:condensation domain-containing protein n=1 Tax=Streptomyces sp. NPDC001985 TaxID=3154406 RepID=UPI003325D525
MAAHTHEPIGHTTGPVALTAAQARVLAAQRADPGNAAYNVGQYIELSGPLDTAALQDAVRHTLAEADGLHFRVREGEDGRLYQEPVPFDAAGWRLPRLDTSGAGDPTAAAVELVREQLACPPRLDLLFTAGGGIGRPAPSLTGAVLVTVGPHRHLLFQFFHHLAVDGYGVALLTRRIAEVYTARLRGTVPRGRPFTPVATLVAAERAYTGSAQYAADRAHWAGRYADRPPATGFAAGSAPPSDTALRHTAVLDRRAGAAVTEAARAARVTWAEAVSAALAVQLHRDTGTREPVLALYTMARTEPGTLRVPGMAVNTLPVRLPLSGDDTFGGVLERTGREFAAVRAHQRFRGEEIARELWPQRSGRLPGPLVNLRPFDTELDFAGVPGHVVSLASGPVDDLSLSVVRYADGRLRLDVDANPALYDARTVARHAVRYTDLLRRLCAEPDRPLAAFPLLDEAGVAAALETGAGAPAPARAREGEPADGGAPDGEEAGPLPLLPSAHRLRESGTPVERLQDSVLLSVEPGLTASVLRRALARLARAHPALRLRLHRVDGIWTTEILPSSVAPAVVGTDTLRRVDAGRAEGAALTALITAEARSAVRALDPGTGTVLRAVWFDAGPERAGRLLLTAHRLSVDDASWQLLVPELAAECAAPARGRAPAAGAPGGGLRGWATALVEQAHGRERAEELPYWRRLLGGGAPRPVRYAAPGPDLVTGAGTPADGDPALFDRAVLTALARAAADEPRLRPDGDALVVEVERPSSARPPRTVGALTTVHPVRVPSAGRSAGAAPGVPDRGRGHEQLRHLNPQTAPVLARAAPAPVRYVRRGGEPEWHELPGWTRAPAGECAALHGALAALPGAEPPVPGALELTVRAGRRGGPSLRWRWAGGLFTDDEARVLTTRITATITTLVTEYTTTEERTR